MATTARRVRIRGDFDEVCAMLSLSGSSQRLRSLTFASGALIGLLACSADAPSGGASRGANAGGGALGQGPGAANPPGSPSNPGMQPGVLPTPSGNPNSLGPEEICASAVVQTNKNMPTIVFVIDGSGSMCEVFGEGTR
ncbi:MAG: hypothetical protein ABW321_07945, partial [Polyangiales bacterium]